MGSWEKWRECWKKNCLWNLSLQASGETARFILDKLQQKRAISSTRAGQIKWLSIISKGSSGSIRNSPSAVITPITLPIADSIMMCFVQSGIGLLQGTDGFCLLWMCVCRESFAPKSLELWASFLGPDLSTAEGDYLCDGGGSRLGRLDPMPHHWWTPGI